MAAASPSNTRAGPSNESKSMPATFTTDPFGASEPVSTARPPTACSGSVSGWTTAPSGRGGSMASRFSATVLPVTVRQSPWSRPASRSSRITTGTPPMRSTSAMWYLPCGLVSAMCGTRAAIRLKSSSSRSTRASAAMASRCSTALVEPPRAIVTAMAFSNASLVRICRARMPFSSSPMIGPARLVGEVVAPAVDGRRRRAAGQRHADGLGDRRHRVRGEHAGAGALGGAGVALDGEQLGVVDRAGGVRTDRLEHADDVERLAVVLARAGSSRRRGRPPAGRAGPRPSASRAATCRTRRR